LCESYDYLRPLAKRATDLKTLQEKTFYGREKKSLAYVIAIMNMILIFPRFHRHPEKSAHAAIARS
jgi:type I restriction-modification system DNA methylase subunit